MPTIFYSWQSDAPNNVNRSLVERALELAVRDLNADIVEAEREEVELTQDTQGVPGTPDIAATIFAKIESCKVFVCDVSLVLTGEKSKGGTRLCPNPNVMLELGYAMKALGQDRILMVCNTAFGRIEDLPFDLRGKRPVPYRAQGTDEADPGDPENRGASCSDVGSSRCRSRCDSFSGDESEDARPSCSRDASRKAGPGRRSPSREARTTERVRPSGRCRR